MEEQLRRCFKCGLKQDKSEFYIDKRNKSGLTGYCRKCANKRISERRRKNPEKFRQRDRLWRAKNPELVKRSEFKYSRTKRGIEVRKKNREKWIKNNPIKNIVAKRKWRKNNQDKVKDEYKRNKDDYITRTRNRKARLKNAKGTFSTKEWNDLKRKHNYTCLCCGKKELIIKLVPDHILALTKGGNNDIGNIQPLCRRCNGIKWNKIISLSELRKLI